MTMMNFLQFMTMEIPDTLAGAMVIIAMAILFIWGIALVFDGHASDRVASIYPWYHPRRWFVPGFPFSLGWFMITQGFLDGILGLLILQTPNGIRVWMFLICVALAATALIAFVWWARDRLPKRKVT